MHKKLKSLFMFLVTVTMAGTIHAQSGKIVAKPSDVILTPVHKIIFQMTSGDTLAHKQLMKQMGNIMSVAPTTKIEVVCHGPGLDMLVADKSVVAENIKKHAKSGIIFNACEFSMKERKVEKDKILQDAGFVEAGIIEIVTRQEQGWSYIKAGF